MAITVTKTYSDATLLSKSNLDAFILSIEVFFNTTKLAASNIKDLGVLTDNIATNAVSAAKIATGAVTTTKILDEAITSAKILDAAITSAKIATDAVTTAKIADAAITTAKIADATVTIQKVALRGVASATALAGGFAVSASCGAFTATSIEPLGEPIYESITNLEVTITSLGNPIIIELIPDGSSSYSYYQIGSGGDTQGGLNLKRTGTSSANMALYETTTAKPDHYQRPAASIKYIDFVAAGTYTYKMQIHQVTLGDDPNTIGYVKLAAREMK